MSQIPADLSQLTTHLIKVTLLDVDPAVIRTLRVPSRIPLSVVHAVLQEAIGWENRHLHEWQIAGVTYAFPDEESWGEEFEDESSVSLADVAPDDSSFGYMYDFGDGWEHLVEVAEVEPWNAETEPITCLGGSGRCPPEDCGGPGGYEHLLDAYRDPDDAEHELAKEILGEAYDPRTFDIQTVNAALSALWRSL